MTRTSHNRCTSRVKGSVLTDGKRVDGMGRRAVGEKAVTSVLQVVGGDWLLLPTAPIP